MLNHKTIFKQKSKILLTIICIFGLAFSYSCSCRNDDKFGSSDFTASVSGTVQDTFRVDNQSQKKAGTEDIKISFSAAKGVNTVDNFEKDMGVFFGLYKKENGTGTDDEYIILSPLNNTGAAYVSFNESHKNALDKIISEIGEEGWGWAVSTIFEDKDYSAETISNNVKKGKINISEEKKNKIQGIIDGLNLTNKKFGTLTKVF